MDGASGYVLVALSLAIVAKRALLGPLRVYARLGLASTTAGFGFLLLPDRLRDETAVTLGIALALGGLGIWAVMFASEVVWTIKHRRLPWT